MDACDRTIEYLRSCGMLCYKPGIAKGKCAAPYVVVRGGGSYAQGMSEAASIGYRIVTGQSMKTHGTETRSKGGKA